MQAHCIVKLDSNLYYEQAYANNPLYKTIKHVYALCVTGCYTLFSLW